MYPVAAVTAELEKRFQMYPEAYTIRLSLADAPLYNSRSILTVVDPDPAKIDPILERLFWISGYCGKAAVALELPSFDHPALIQASFKVFSNVTMAEQVHVRHIAHVSESLRECTNAALNWTIDTYNRPLWIFYLYPYGSPTFERTSKERR